MGGLPALTYEEKILLHLLDYLGMEEKYQVDPGVTQGAIADAVGIQRKHLSRSLDSLVKKEYLSERKAHVSGARQVRRVYFLSWKGQVVAKRLHESLVKETVLVREPGTKGAGKYVERTVAQAHETAGIKLPFLRLVDAVGPDRKVDLAALTATKPAPKRGASRGEETLGLYKEAIEKAWVDGRISLNERAVLDMLRERLHVNAVEADRSERETVAKLPIIRQERIDIYLTALRVSLRNLHISQDEADILEALRENLAISMPEHERMKEEVHREMSAADPIKR